MDVPLGKVILWMPLSISKRFILIFFEIAMDPGRSGGSSKHCTHWYGRFFVLDILLYGSSQKPVGKPMTNLPKCGRAVVPPAPLVVPALGSLQKISFIMYIPHGTSINDVTPSFESLNPPSFAMSFMDDFFGVLAID